MENKEKLFHFHLEDGYGNAKTLVCLVVNGSIKYSFYGGHGSSGTPFSLSNIQYYDIVNGNMAWKRNASLPVSNLEGETIFLYFPYCKYTNESSRYKGLLPF
jgi:hypothetical protein